MAEKLPKVQEIVENLHSEAKKTSKTQEIANNLRKSPQKKPKSPPERQKRGEIMLFPAK